MSDATAAVKDATEVTMRYVDRDGAEREVTANVGESLMTVATGNKVLGIDGDCGGNCACGTCNVLIESQVALTLNPPDAVEPELLEFIGSDASKGYRLGCQVTVTRALADAKITVATT